MEWHTRHQTLSKTLDEPGMKTDLCKSISFITDICCSWNAGQAQEAREREGRQEGEGTQEGKERKEGQEEEAAGGPGAQCWAAQCPG